MATETLPFTPGRTRRPPERPVPGRERPGRERPGRQTPRPVSSPRHTRPLGADSADRAQPRAPFIVLLVGLLGGALVSLLVISTTLDEGSYQINHLTQQNNALFRAKQTLLDEVATDSNPGTIAREALGLGMRPDKGLQFISLITGTIRVSPPVLTAP